MCLKNKKILIGVSGSISAYKIALLVRLLIKEGSIIKIVMTESAKTFITPLTLSTLSKSPVLSTFLVNETGTWNNHVELGLWADVMLIAPASANTLAKCANGFCDNLLVATYLSARCKVFFAPAMDLDMYSHFSTINNLEILTKNGNQIIEPNEGELASGLEGKGRMAEPDQILKYLEANFAQVPILKGKRVLISAGPTQEALDPVRFISNHSSGKMGYEIANSFALAGAQVTLISGPTSLQEISFVKTISVYSAQEMMEKMDEYHKESDIVIFSAAVADYTPAKFSNQKIKKNGSEMSLELKKTVDIAAELGKKKSLNQIHVGFALETNDELLNALSKLRRKNFDLVVLNSLQDKGAGFRLDTNKITIIQKNGNKKEFELKSKKKVAQDIMHEVLEYLKSNQ